VGAATSEGTGAGTGTGEVMNDDGVSTIAGAALAVTPSADIT